jgi:hypothetical protein
MGCYRARTGRSTACFSEAENSASAPAVSSRSGHNYLSESVRPQAAVVSLYQSSVFLSKINAQKGHKFEQLNCYVGASFRHAYGAMF